jgi:ribulose 1,5-bisphosphate synthetase/thiazole synthase
MLKYVKILIFIFILIINTSNKLCEKLNNHHDYCLIGAGPSGLQLAYFLNKYHKNYIVFEKSNVSGI